MKCYPVIARAWAHIPAEGVTAPLPFADPLPDDLLAMKPFTEEESRRGLSAPALPGLDGGVSGH